MISLMFQFCLYWIKHHLQDILCTKLLSFRKIKQASPFKFKTAEWISIYQHTFCSLKQIRFRTSGVRRFLNHFTGNQKDDQQIISKRVPHRENSDAPVRRGNGYNWRVNTLSSSFEPWNCNGSAPRRVGVN